MTVHGKGSFIANTNQELLMEERRKELEKELEAAVQQSPYRGTDGERKSGSHLRS